MAYQKKSTKTQATQEETKIASETTVAEKKKKEFKNDDLIYCKSITNGLLGMIGIKSKILYRWSDRGDVTPVEYADLMAAVMQKTDHIRLPRFIIEDEDFLALPHCKWIKKIYDSMFDADHLKDILKMNPSQMKKAIGELPDGAKESIKGLAAKQIQAGQLDSVKKIKTLDEIFGTELMLMTGLFN